jgi:hypothetical protein
LSAEPDSVGPTYDSPAAYVGQCDIAAPAQYSILECGFAEQSGFSVSLIDFSYGSYFQSDEIGDFTAAFPREWVSRMAEIADYRGDPAPILVGPDGLMDGNGHVLVAVDDRFAIEMSLNTGTSAVGDPCGHLAEFASGVADRAAGFARSLT